MTLPNTTEVALRCTFIVRCPRVVSEPECGVSFAKNNECRSQPFPTKKQSSNCRLDFSSRTLQLLRTKTVPWAVNGKAVCPQHSVTLPSHVALLPIHRFGRCPPTQTPVQARCSGTHSLLSGCPEVRYACGPRRTSSTKQNHSSHTLPHAVRRE